MFPLTLLSLLSALQQRISPAQLRAYLLDEEVDDGAVDAPLPLVARFGEFSINATDVHRALHAPLLTESEVATLRSISLRAADTDVSSAKYTADVADLSLSEPSTAARGIAHLLRVPSLELHARMGRGVAAIEEEFATHDPELLVQRASVV